VARISYTLRLNADRTLSIIVRNGGRTMRESFGLLGKNRAEIFDAVKWALVSKDAYISDERLTEDLHHLIWRHL